MNSYPPGGGGSAAQRQQTILLLVGGGRVRSQGELARLLRRRGIAVAQPTLSRDLRELGLAKTPTGYVAPRTGDPERVPPAARRAKLARALQGFARSVEAAGSLVIVKTPPAGAQPVARALDEAAPPGLAGTIAGDDTVFVATRGERAARHLARHLAGLASPAERRLPA